MLHVASFYLLTCITGNQNSQFESRGQCLLDSPMLLLEVGPFSFFSLSLSLFCKTSSETCRLGVAKTLQDSMGKSSIHFYEGTVVAFTIHCEAMFRQDMLVPLEGIQ